MEVKNTHLHQYQYQFWQETHYIRLQKLQKF